MQSLILIDGISITILNYLTFIIFLSTSLLITWVLINFIIRPKNLFKRVIIEYILLQFKYIIAIWNGVWPFLACIQLTNLNTFASFLEGKEMLIWLLGTVSVISVTWQSICLIQVLGSQLTLVINVNHVYQTTGKTDVDRSRCITIHNDKNEITYAGYLISGGLSDNFLWIRKMETWLLCNKHKCKNSISLLSIMLLFCLLTWFTFTSFM